MKNEVLHHETVFEIVIVFTSLNVKQISLGELHKTKVQFDELSSDVNPLKPLTGTEWSLVTLPRGSTTRPPSKCTHSPDIFIPMFVISLHGSPVGSGPFCSLDMSFTFL